MQFIYQKVHTGATAERAGPPLQSVRLKWYLSTLILLLVVSLNVVLGVTLGLLTVNEVQTLGLDTVDICTN